MELSSLTAVAQGHQLQGAPGTKRASNSRAESIAPCPAVSSGPQRRAIWLVRDTAGGGPA